MSRKLYRHEKLETLKNSVASRLERFLICPTKAADCSYVPFVAWK